MQKTYAIGDIHGAAKALRQCLNRAGVNTAFDRVIQLGDVTDTYGEVYECVEILLKLKNLIAIKGNHDVWFNRFISSDYHPKSWSNGGLGTLTSYLNHAGKSGQFTQTGSGYDTTLSSLDIPASHWRFFASQRLYYIDEQNRCFVHAGFKRGIPISIQEAGVLYEDRTLWEQAYGAYQRMVKEHLIPKAGPVNEYREVYLGHTPTTNYDTDQPIKAFNIWNLDTGVSHSGRLTIMDVETKQYWQSDPVRALYPNGPP